MKPAPVYLDRLAAVLVRSGWATLPRYNGPTPVLHVYAATVPSLGESVCAVPGPDPHQLWYRSSTGSFLAPCTHPMKAAEAVAAILSPHVEAALSRRAPLTWWGEQTRQWWALVSYGNSSRLLAASTPEELARVIARTRRR